MRTPADWEAAYTGVRKTCALPTGSKEEKGIGLPAGAELRREALGRGELPAPLRWVQRLQ